jgi:hypothetical protein
MRLTSPLFDHFDAELDDLVAGKLLGDGIVAAIEEVEGSSKGASRSRPEQIDTSQAR